MQTFRPLVFIRLISLFVSSSIFGALIWENPGSDPSVSFSKLNRVAVSASLPDNLKSLFKSELERLVHNRATVVYVDDVMKDLSKILSADLVVHFVLNTTDAPSIQIFQVSASTQIEIQANQSTQNGVIWQKSFLFQDENLKLENLKSSILKSMVLFVDQYFSSRKEDSLKPIFYFFFNP